MSEKTRIGETVTRNIVQRGASLTIAVPTYRDMPAQLIRALMQCAKASNVALLIYDDGSDDSELTSTSMQCVMEWPGQAALITASENAGRSYSRNRLLMHAQTDWILFLDADMLPDHQNFLTTYLEAIRDTSEPALIAGGFSLDQVTASSQQALHAAQSRKSECLSSEVRSKEPGRFVFTSNILVHRFVLESVGFDDGFTGWGWEDVDWGLRVAKAFPVLHIDNTATHLGLDDTDTLLAKYGNSGANFARMVKRHPDAAKMMPLTKVTRKLANLPGRSIIRAISKALTKSFLPTPLRLQALKLYRAAAYAEHMK